jgi:hypothetical protein
MSRTLPWRGEHPQHVGRVASRGIDIFLRQDLVHRGAVQVPRREDRIDATRGAVGVDEVHYDVIAVVGVELLAVTRAVAVRVCPTGDAAIEGVVFVPDVLLERAAGDRARVVLYLDEPVAVIVDA